MLGNADQKPDPERPDLAPSGNGKQPPKPKKKLYNTPVLTDLGTVGDLSMSGSGGGVENMPGMGSKMKRP